MTWPASLTVRNVKGHFVTYPDGAPAVGQARIVLAKAMQGPTDDAFVVPFDITIKFVDGRFSAALPANDDPQWTPSYYRITITTFADSRLYCEEDRRLRAGSTIFQGGQDIRTNFVVPYNSTADIDLTDIFNLPAVTPGESYIVLASKGAPGGVATLGSDGYITPSQMPPGSDGDVSWTDVQDKPTTFTPSAHAHVTSDVTGLDAALAAKASSTDLTSGLAGKANTSHNHAASDIASGTLATTRGGTGISAGFTASSYLRASSTTALEFRSAAQVLSDIGAAAAVHSHVTSDVTGLDTALSGKFDKSGGTISSDLSVTGYTGLHGVTVANDLVVQGYTSLQGMSMTGDLEVPNLRVTGGTYLDGAIYSDLIGAKVVVLNSTDPVPDGTPSGSVIIRTP